MTIEEMREMLAAYDEEEAVYKAQWDKAGGFSLGDPDTPRELYSPKVMPTEALLTGKNITVWHHQRYREHIFHAHKDVHFVYMLSGSGENITEGERVELHAGDICVISPYAWHLPIVHGDSVMINIIVRKSRLENLIAHFKHESSVSEYLHGLFDKRHRKFLHIKSSEDEFTSELVDRLLLSFYDGQWCDCELERWSLFEALICRLMRFPDALTASSKSEFSDNNNLATEISEIIDAEYRTLTLDELASRLGYTKTHICRVIKATRGTTFSSLVNRLRINDACKMLRTSKLGIAEISYECGFASVEYFTRTFKSLMGVSPGEFRKG